MTGCILCASERFQTGSGFHPPPQRHPRPVERWVPPPPGGGGGGSNTYVFLIWGCGQVQVLGTILDLGSWQKGGGGGPHINIIASSAPLYTHFSIGVQHNATGCLSPKQFTFWLPCPPPPPKKKKKKKATLPCPYDLPGGRIQWRSVVTLAQGHTWHSKHGSSAWKPTCPTHFVVMTLLFRNRYAESSTDTTSKHGVLCQMKLQ